MFALVEIPNQKAIAKPTQLLDSDKHLYEVQTKILHYPDPYWLKMEEWEQDSTLKILDRIKMPVYEDKKGTHFIVFYEGTYSEMRQVLCCGGKVKAATTAQIQEALRENGYVITINDKMTDETKSALIHFQKKNGFPLGNLNMETLRALGLQY